MRENPKFNINDTVKLTGRITKIFTNDITGQGWSYKVAIEGATLLEMQLHNATMEIHERAIEK